ncbi:MAG TPA: hypothetical protein VN609_08745, partial [Propionibacteriaceae bacterium]|nr:hypothetical protein [Propionibacteriaceae bacterium]
AEEDLATTGTPDRTRPPPLGTRIRAEPGPERLFVSPAGYHQPLLPVVSWLEQLEPLEAA